MFDTAEIEIKCPKCGTKAKKTIGWLKTHNSMVCRCGTTIQFDKSKFTGPLKKVEKSLDDLKRSFKRLENR